mmetsp:Transcript_6061/g.9311  ORF Transcript_6061/g.9311 Transcript_6061/m.9311 type:complete len:232 (+) Transcript_6061:151-846(+)|eukprot:CAMPEP_0184648022 /NCGR_PEP_ID=MMETSP0308-20130426/5080_1 /TAXON_ID=38269 /ORGANISM="Gloeochaete witrockiana, Strain SAG 46.84" /LENGTH=231 /DNA_ID=CAMNT_0027079513 /DNA_START=45 /DNA_END=740 /DNA_ORIENTATION=+
MTTPGPGAYNVTENWTTKPQSPAWSLVSCKKIAPRDEVPGPEYSQEFPVIGRDTPGVIKSPTHVFGTGPRGLSLGSLNAPAPGAYNSVVEIGREGCIRKTAPLYSFGGGQINVKESPAKIPLGPGTYKPEVYNESWRGASPKYVFGTGPKIRAYQSSCAPGPGAYDQKNMVGDETSTDATIQHSSAWSFGNSKRDASKGGLQAFYSRKSAFYPYDMQHRESPSFSFGTGRR